MPRIVLLNGILTDGAGNIDRLLPLLRGAGHEVEDAWYPKINPFNARWQGHRIARELADHYQPGDVLIGHSFGCYIAAQLMRLRVYDAVFMIAPAMSKRWKFGDLSKGPRVYCWHSNADTALKLGRLLLFHPFGAAGITGYTHPAVVNLHTHCRHSEYFTEPYISRVVATIQGHLSELNAAGLRRLSQ